MSRDDAGTLDDMKPCDVGELDEGSGKLSDALVLDGFIGNADSEEVVAFEIFPRSLEDEVALDLAATLGVDCCADGDVAMLEPRREDTC
ncbi:hypothetical protein J3458_016867 [Metarhizium acridum]|uniref:uncharacterized protein n=1 Tax=Metarhizium acridum TaxID=92637 RepID=UPI001C6A91CC|nr:hypothetical protein J3458_016867 [Metarhizium acridum]